MVIVLAYATTESHRARAQSALADGARARNRTLRVDGINATSVTAHKPPFPYSRIMLLISIRLSVTKFPPDQRVDQDGVIQLLDRSSTSTASLSTITSTKNSQNITMRRSGRSAVVNFRNHFGGHSVMVAVIQIHQNLLEMMKRFPRYSLRTLLVATLLVACLFAYTSHHYRQIKSAYVAVKAVGGTASHSVDGPKWIRDLINDNEYFYHLERITLGASTGNCQPGDITDETISALIPHFRKYSRLSILELADVAVTDRGISMLSILPGLKQLHLKSSHISDLTIDSLQKFENLEWLMIDCCPGVTTEAIDRLRIARPNLEVNYILCLPP
jgi:hypothetical protein